MKTFEERLQELEADKKIQNGSYKKEQYGHYVNYFKQGKIVNLRFRNWNANVGQLVDNEKYEIELPFTSLLYTQGTYIEVNNNKLTIKTQKANTWHDETIMFLIN